MLYMELLFSQVWATVAEADGCLYTGSADCTARRWSRASGRCLQMYCGHQHWVLGARTMNHSDQPFVFTSARDSCVRKWCRDTGHCLAEWRPHSAVPWVLHVVGDTVFTAAEGCIKQWSVAASQMHAVPDHVQSWSTEGAEVTSIRVQGDRVVVGASDGVVRHYSATSGARLNDTVPNTKALQGERMPQDDST